MPLDVLERHPFLNYHESPEARHVAYQGLVVGSFPVFAVTDSVDLQGNIFNRRFWSAQARMKFFYSSGKSDFWEYCSKAFGEDGNPALAQSGDVSANGVGTAQQRCIDFLIRHKLLMTDAVYQTNREGQGGEDNDLWKTAGAPEALIPHLQLNHNLPALLTQYPTIRNLYFTATGQTGKCPFGWFRTIFERQLTATDLLFFDGRLWSSVCTIGGRVYNAFFLPTPKPRGIHFTDDQRMLQFVNYLQHQHPLFYNQISSVPKARRTRPQKQTLSNHRYSFLVESYRQAMVHNNRQFDGTLPND
jgi:hypothetical protein